LVDDRRTNIALAKQGVADEQVAPHRQDAQQLQGGLVLIGLGIDAQLGQHGLGLRPIGRNQVLSGHVAVAAAASGLAVQGDGHPRTLRQAGGDPAGQGVLEGLHIEHPEEDGESGLGGSLAAGEAQGVGQCEALVAAELSDGLVTFRPGEHGQNRQGEDGGEGVASAMARAGIGLTGAHVGQPLSSEITFIGAPTSCCEGEGHTATGAQREPGVGAAESQTLCMRGNSLRENRETPRIPSAEGGEGRPEKARGRASGVHVLGESDDPLVPTKQANQGVQPGPAESAEGRGLAKGNVFAVGRAPDTEPDPRVDRREGVREVARRDKKVRFTALRHHVTPELL
jgi:hypothetical protein